MQKRLNLFLSSILSIIISSALISAQQTPLEGAEGFITIIQEIFGTFFAAIFGTSELLFEKVLFLFILISFVYVVIRRFPAFQDNPAVVWIITLSVAILSTRFMTDFSWVQAILLPYGVLGVTLLSLIPFVIFFYYVEFSIESELLRKISWTLYSVIFIGLWWSRYPLIGSPAWIFVATAFISILMILFDGTIRGFFVRSAINKGLKDSNVLAMVKLQKDIKDLNNALNTATGSAQIDNILKQIKEAKHKLKQMSKGPYI
ncbi:MAG: hypothetical protein Q7S33_02695 [Nanoarchaeota archaeon]|nr:hypothetical protein [Nanoarchaeota archaeon]